MSPRLETFCRVSGMVAIVACAHASRAGLSHNLPAAYADTRAAIAAGGGTIVCIGDSLTQREDAFGDALRQRLHAFAGDGGWGYQGFSVWTGGGFYIGWTNGQINADTPPHRALDGLWASYTPGPVTDAFFDARSASIVLHYLAQPGGGSFDMEFPDGTHQVVGTDGPSALRTFSHTFPSWQRRVIYRPVMDGPIVILGQDNQSGLPGPRVHKAANGGWGVDNFLQRDWSFDAQLQSLNPDLILVMLGQNDMRFGRTDYAERMMLLIDRLRATVPQTEIVLISTYDSGSNQLPLLAAGVEDAAIAKATGFINLYEAGGPYDFYLANSLLDADALHFSAAGGAYVAGVVLDALETEGESLAPCGDPDFNNDFVYPDTTDLFDFLSVFAGGPCPTGNCDSIDVNKDGVFPDGTDLFAFLGAFSGGGAGGCP